MRRVWQCRYLLLHFIECRHLLNHHNRQPPPHNPGAHVSSLAQYNDMYRKSIADPKVPARPAQQLRAAVASSNFAQAFWSELALQNFSFKFEGDATAFKHVLRYNFNM